MLGITPSAMSDKMSLLQDSATGSRDYGTASSTPGEQLKLLENGHHAIVVHKNKLGLLNGVIVPCLLNIVGAVVFLRLTWAIGQAGWLGVLSMLLIAEVQGILTVLSLSAILTNGEMKGGGSYYLISRSVGPELGGAIGILFYLAYSVGATFYIVAFSEEFVLTWLLHVTSIPSHWLHVLVGTGALIFVVIIGLIGADAFTKINVPLFVIQFLTIFVAVIAFLVRSPSSETLVHGGTYDGWHGKTFVDNALPSYASDPVACPAGHCNYLGVFAIIFPAATGIMEGANLSGDLANPARTIPKGTLFAILFSFCTYIFVIFSSGGAFSRRTLQINPSVLQDATFWDYGTVIGVCVSTLSSALGAVFGGSRLLQAVARDKILPVGSKWLGFGASKGDEPRVAVLATFIIAQGCLFIGGLDVVAPIIASFFCLSYAFTNFSCFLLSISGTPNWRPRFKYFSWHTALLGTILNIGVMFALNWIYATVCLGLLLFIAIYLVIWPPEGSEGWGDARQAIIFHQVRKYLLRLDYSQAGHGKLWRPSIMFLVKQGELDSAATLLCKYLKKGGVFVLGHVLIGEFEQLAGAHMKINSEYLDFIDEYNLKAFPQVVIAANLRAGVQNLLVTAGLGCMTPNSVAITEPQRDSEQRYVYDTGSHFGSTAAYQHTFEDSRRVGKNVLLLCNLNDMSMDSLLERIVPSSSRTIDVFILPHVQLSSFKDFVGNSLLQVQLAHLLMQDNVSLRLIRLTAEFDASDFAALSHERDTVENIVKREGRFRIGSKGDQLFVIPCMLSDIEGEGALEERPMTVDIHSMNYWCNVNTLIKREVTQETCFVFLPLPPLDLELATMYVAEMLCRNLPPLCCACASEEQTIMSTAL